jgi:hypothetical protein
MLSVPYQFGLRSLLIVVTIVALVLGGWYWWNRSVAEPRERNDRIRALVDYLALKRPRDMTRSQWGSAVAWTHNLVGNSLLNFEADVDDLRRFQTELERRAGGDVDMATIHWIWDEHARLTPSGARYQRFREVMLDEIARVGPNDDPWGMHVP